MDSTPTRRRYLRILAAGTLPAVAGCSGGGDTGDADDDGDDEADDDTEPTTEAGTQTPDDSSTPDEERDPGRLVAKTTIGSDISDGTVGRVAMAVTVDDGTVDLSGLTVQWVDADGAETLTSDQFTVEAIRDEDGSLGESPPILDADDRANLVFDLSAFRDGGLEEGERATVTLTTQAERTTQVGLTVPETLAGSERVTL